MKRLSSLAVLFALTALSAAQVTTDFSAGKATRWHHNSWSGYAPVPEYGFDPASRSFHSAAAQSKYGIGYTNQSELLPAKAGDTVNITVVVKGKGKFFAGIQNFSRGKWAGMGQTQTVVLTDDWREFRFAIPVTDVNRIPADKVMLSFGGSKDTEFYLRKISASVDEGKYFGSLMFPGHWIVFASVDPKFKPSQAELVSIPKKLDGKTGTQLPLLSNTIDFAKVMKQAVGQCAWAFAEIDSPCDEYLYSIGAGADWWMTFYVNGKPVIDTSARGNGDMPLAFNNHVVTAKLKKGRNIFAVRFASGRASSLLMMGGPSDLRNIVRFINVTKVLVQDDYENKTAARSGSPELISGNPAPGLLTITGQAVYKTSGKLDITLPVSEYTLGKEWFTTGVRIQNFGRDERKDSSLSFDIADGKLELRISHSAKNSSLLCEFLDNGTCVRTFDVPYRLLPADFQFSFSRNGVFVLRVTSLSDSSSLQTEGKSAVASSLGDRKFRTKLVFRSKNGTPAEIVLDNYMTGLAEPGTRSNAIPYTVDLFRTFDPEKAGWKMVFQDEFDGTEVDWNKWMIPSWHTTKEGFLKPDGKGILVIKADYADASKKKLHTQGIWTKQTFLYGYFEARVRFTRQPGWWAAFWLCSQGITNPFTQGVEIDIFEDYYNRRKENAPGGKLDHNLHMKAGGEETKSWNYNSVPGDLNKFHVIGCKWTPFEISYYLDGKLISSTASHSPYDSVTFDGFNHGLCTMPLHAIVSGQTMGPHYKDIADISKGTYPETYLVDYVRIYEYPRKNPPEIRWKAKPEPGFRKVGSVVRVEAEANPNPETKSPIKAVYLFDNGFMLGYKTKPPYTFEFPFTPAFFKGTAFCKPGRQGVPMGVEGIAHQLKFFVQDEAGNVAFTDNLFLVPFEKASSPYEGKPQTIPGTVRVSRFDEGGKNIAWHDSTKGNAFGKAKNTRPDADVDISGDTIGHACEGEWINYTVDVTKAGTYNISAKYGKNGSGNTSVTLFADGKPVGQFPIRDTGSWAIANPTQISGVKLTEGKHVLTIFFHTSTNLGNLEFQLQ